MDKNWKYLAIVLVFTYLVSGFVAVGYADVSDDLFGIQRGGSNEKKMWDFSNAEDIGGYMDVITDSLGEKTIDFIMAFGVVFASLWMGLSMIGGFGGGYQMNSGVKSAQMAFAAFAAIGTAFYVNMNDIPFTKVVAPYALFLTILILALILGNMIIKLKQGNAGWGLILIASGMCGLVIGLGANKLLKEMGMGGWGAFIALIGIILLIIGVIKAISDAKDKSPADDIRKAEDQAVRDSQALGADEQQEERITELEEKEVSELQQAVMNNNYPVAIRIAERIRKENADASGLLRDELNRVNKLLNEAKYVIRKDIKDARTGKMRAHYVLDSDKQLTEEEENKFRDALALKRIIEEQFILARDIDKIFLHDRVLGEGLGLLKSLEYLSNKAKKIGIFGRVGSSVINPSKYPYYYNARRRVVIFIQRIHSFLAEYSRLEPQKSNLIYVIKRKEAKSDTEAKKKARGNKREKKTKKKVDEEERLVFRELVLLHNILTTAITRKYAGANNVSVIKHDDENFEGLMSIYYKIKDIDNPREHEALMKRCMGFGVQFLKDLKKIEDRESSEKRWMKSKWVKESIRITRRMIKDAEKALKLDAEEVEELTVEKNN